MELTDAVLSRIIAEIGGTDSERWDSSDLAFLVTAAQGQDLLCDLTVHELIPEGRRDDSFLFTVTITGRITVSSPPLRWREVAPAPGLTGREAVRQLLEWIERTAARIRADFTTDAVLRGSPELVRAAEVSWAARSLDARWREHARQFQNAEGDIEDNELRAYDELRNTYALEAWELCRNSSLV